MERARRGWRRWGHRLDIALQLAGAFATMGIVADLTLLLLLGLGLAHFVKLLLVVMFILLGFTCPFWLLIADENWRIRRARQALAEQGALLERAQLQTAPSEAELIAAREGAAEDVWIAALTIGFLVAFTVMMIVIGHISPNPYIRMRFDPRGVTVFSVPALIIAISSLAAKLIRSRRRVRAVQRVLRGEMAG